MDNNDSTGGGGGRQRRRWGRHEAGKHQKPSPDKEAESLAKLLPSERDREAVMGCLAAVLNIMLAARRRKDGNDDDGANDAAVVAAAATGGFLRPGANKSGEDNDGGGGGGGGTIDRDDVADEPGGSATTGETRGRPGPTSLSRARAFRRDLLNASAGHLLLPPDRAAAFLPPDPDDSTAGGGEESESSLRRHLESLSGPDASFRCVALLVFRFLLSSGGGGGRRSDGDDGGGEAGGRSPSPAPAGTTIVGYDARVRHAFKHLAVSVLSFWDPEGCGTSATPERAAARATRKFEALEDGIASRLSALSRTMQEGGDAGGEGKLAGRKQRSTFGQNAIRGLKIGAAGVAAGTIFAVTGGLAAPAIVGGIAALTGVSSTVAVVASILLLPAATTVFGVGGGTLVVNKMTKRTAGLKEFDIARTTSDGGGVDGSDGADSNAGKGDDGRGGKVHLSRTVCVGGWLRDEHDAERPFGATPRALTDRHELLCRHCSVHAPLVVPDCRRILEAWRGREGELWDACAASHGRDPGSLLPLGTGPRRDASLTEGEEGAVDGAVRAAGLPSPSRGAEGSRPHRGGREPATPPSAFDSIADAATSGDDESRTKEKMSDATLRSYQAWDFHAEYGGEQYVVLWEKDLLIELAGSARKMLKDGAKKAAEEVLKKTAMASLMAAVALPAALLSLTNIIDEQWTLVAERSDEAGVLLAQSLLNSNAGHRPVSLIGFSFGARVIIACLKELARNQAIWEHQQEGREPKGSMAASLRKTLNMPNKQKEVQLCYSREPASIIEDVILMGTPASVNSKKWLSYREIVGGRLINCYSKNDMILALMYRVKNLASVLTPPVGISHVDVAGIENFDVSKFVANHGEYCVAVREILDQVGYNQPCQRM